MGEYHPRRLRCVQNQVTFAQSDRVGTTDVSSYRHPERLTPAYPSARPDERLPT